MRLIKGVAGGGANLKGRQNILNKKKLVFNPYPANAENMVSC